MSSMQASPVTAAAALLPNRKVVVAAGTPATTEVFVPATDCSLTGTLTLSRAYNKAVLPGTERVAITGGAVFDARIAAAELY